jgi:hypothetical protein
MQFVLKLTSALIECWLSKGLNREILLAGSGKKIARGENQHSRLVLQKFRELQKPSSEIISLLLEYFPI